MILCLTWIVIVKLLVIEAVISAGVLSDINFRQWGQVKAARVEARRWA